MRRRERGKGAALLGVAVLMAACSGGAPPALPSVARPNVLLILVDQVSLRLGSYGSPAKTPNLDRLAARGRRFDRAYGQYPALVPSRLALLLGRRPETSRLWQAPESRDAFGGALPLPEAFRSRGYATARVGPVLGPSDPLVAWDETADPKDAAATARQAADLLARRKEASLFLTVGFGASPPGALPPASFFTLYDPRRLRAEPATLPGDLPAMATADAGVAPGAPSPPQPEEQRRRGLAAELAHVSAVDAQVGVILEALDRLGLTDKTIVVLVGDTAPRGPGPRPDLLLEDRLRSALIVAGPGVREPGTATDGLVELVDVFPTLADLASLPKTEGQDGVSLRPLLDDPRQAVRDAAVSAVQRFGSPLGKSVRTERWRYTEWPDGSRELYDHDAEPGELRSHAADPAQAAVMRELHERLAASAAPAVAPVAPPAPARRPAAGVPGTRPNVLLVMVDDLNVRVGCYGYPVQTPAIDRLAREGRRFDRAYCQIASCSPSRTSLLTGWRPERTGVFDNLQTPRERLTGAVPLQEHFHANGYFTARVGKIYHGPFEEQFHWDLAEHTPYLAGDEAWEPPSKKEREKAGSSARPWTATSNRDEDEPDGRTVRRVARLLEQHRDRPFFIAAGLNKPHIHWIAPRRYFDLYPPDRIELPREPDDDRDDIPEIALFRRAARAPGRFLTGTGERDDAFRREATAAYYACVSFADAQIAVLLEALDRLKLREKTIVVVLSDHGFHLGEHGGLWRKNTLFEEALRVPFVIAAPGLGQPGVASRSVVESLDLYPTLVELARLPPVPGVEGVSLLPILEEPGRSVKPAAFSVAPRSAPELGRSVRTERWRYTEWPDGARELYDLAPPGAWARFLAAVGLPRDPAPPRNLASEPQSTGTIAEMQARLDRVGR